jgi:hypothetical protein
MSLLRRKSNLTYMIENNNVKSIVRADSILIPLVLHYVHRAPTRRIARLIRWRIVVAKPIQGLSYLRDTTSPSDGFAAFFLAELAVRLGFFVLNECLHVELFPIVEVCELEDGVM